MSSTIKHITDTKGTMSSRRFIAMERPVEVDTAEIRRQIRVNKGAGHARLPTHHTTLEKLLETWDLVNGKPEDLRRKYGESHDDA